jgi:hypothetical protein
MADALMALLPNLGQTEVECAHIFAGNETAVMLGKSVSLFTNLTNDAFVDLAKDCDRFRQRGYFTMSLNSEEEQFPLAFIIQMYKDVVQLETLLRAIYRPHNVYCINVDKSSKPDVHRGVEAIAKCFHNVILTGVDVAWGRFSQVAADLVSLSRHSFAPC